MTSLITKGRGVRGRSGAEVRIRHDKSRFVCLLKSYSPANRTGSPQGFTNLGTGKGCEWQLGLRCG